MKTEIEITARAKPPAIQKTLLPDGALLVHAITTDNRHLVVVWHEDGTGYPVTDELTDVESDAVWAVAKQKFRYSGCAGGLVGGAA
jgi:hypothetical protein